MRRTTRLLIAHLVVLASALGVLLPALLSGSFHRSHEEARYLLLADHFIEAFRAGVLYPRFIPDLNGGYGYPTFCFYQPGFFYVTLLFSYLPLPLHQSMQAALLALLYLGALGAFQLGRELAGYRFGLFAGPWFLLTPYLCVNLYVRGDLSELASMLLCPWPIFFLLRLSRRLAQGHSPAAAMLGLALSTAAVITMHPAPPAALLPSLAAMALALAARAPRRGALLLRFAASLALGLAVSSPYWLTVFQLRPYVRFEQLVVDYSEIERHSVWPLQLISNGWDFGASMADSSQDYMSFQLGAPHLLAAMLGAWFGWRRSPAIAAAFACYALLILLMLPLSEAFWLRAPLLRFLQFPWRLLGVTATLQLVAAMGLREWSERTLSPRGASVALGAILLISFVWHAQQFQISKPMHDPEDVRRLYHEEIKRGGFHIFANVGEFTPLTARNPLRAPRASDTMLKLEQAGRGRRAKDDSKYRLRYEVSTPARNAVVIEQIYLPGWRVWLDGEPVDRATLEAGLKPSGLMSIELPEAGRYMIEAYYEGPPGWRIRDAGIAAVVLAVLPLLRRPRARVDGEGGRG